MRQLLVELKARGPPADDDADIASQLYRVLGEKVRTGTRMNT